MVAEGVPNAARMAAATAAVAVRLAMVPAVLGTTPPHWASLAHPKVISGGRHADMASQTKTVTDYVDDIENKPFDEGAGETLSFSFDGKPYEIDLNTKNAAKMRKAFQFYVDHARPGASNSGPPRGRGRVVSAGTRGAAGRDYDLAELRQWAADTGIRLPARGRIKGEIIEQYKASRG